MLLDFYNLRFEIKDDIILLKKIGNIENKCGCSFVEVQVCGENKDTHMGAKMTNSSEGRRLKYISHSIAGYRLEIVQRSEIIEAKSIFEAYSDTSAVRVHTEIKNLSSENIVLEEVSAFTVTGIGKRGIDSAKEL